MKVYVLLVGLALASALWVDTACATVEGLRAAQQAEAGIRCQWSFEGADMATALKNSTDDPERDLTAHGSDLALVSGAAVKSQALKLPGTSAYVAARFPAPPVGTLELIVTPASASHRAGVRRRAIALLWASVNAGSAGYVKYLKPSVSFGSPSASPP